VRRRSREHHLVVVVVVSFGLAFLSFVVSRTITEVVARRVEKDAESIGGNALSATEALGGARESLRGLLFGMNTLRQGAGTGQAAKQLGDRLTVDRQEMAASWARYTAIPFYPGERELVERTDPDLRATWLAVDEIDQHLQRGEREAALRIVDERALPSLERADEGLGELIRFNGDEARHAAARILASGRPWGFWPEILGAFFGLTAAYFGVRLLMQYLGWAAERSAELEGFAGRVAHDIRSPLGSAALALDLAQRGKDIDSRTREMLSRASRTMERIAKLVDGLLVFASSGGYLVSDVPSDPSTSTGDVLRGVVEDLKFEAEEKKIAIDYQAPDPAPVVACSPGVLISIATNLVSNAMKYMGDAPVRRITVRVRRAGDDVELSVSDTGPGIAPELQARIFEAGVRGETTVPGLGLGLATVRKLAEAHGGGVRIESAPGRGTTFRVTLPTPRPTPRPLALPHRPAHQSP
jgi:signal transduction histidine kinase